MVVNPDFIPILGYLDDVILLPLGIYLAIRWLPEEVWRDAQQHAEQQPSALASNEWAAWVIGLMWLAMLAAAGYYAWSLVRAGHA